MLVNEKNGDVFETIHEVPPDTVVTPTNGHHEDSSCRIGENSKICNVQFDLSYKGSHILDVGNDTELSNVVVHSPTKIGNRCKLIGSQLRPIHSGTTHPWYSNEFLRKTTIFNNVTIGEGTNISSGVCIYSNVSVGKNCVIGTLTFIEKNVVIEDFVRIADKCFIDTRVKVKKSATIETMSSIFYPITIYDKAHVGPGLSVSSDYNGVYENRPLAIPPLPGIVVRDYYQLLPPIFDLKDMLLVLPEGESTPILVFDDKIFHDNEKAVEYCIAKISNEDILHVDKRPYVLAKKVLECLSEVEEMDLFDHRLLRLWLKKTRRGIESSMTRPIYQS